jgi:competence protein ComEA
MADEGPLLGVSTAAPAPPTWSAAPAPDPPSPPEPPTWSREAQWTTAGLLVVFLALLAWRGIGLSRWTTRPLQIEEGVLPRDAIDLNDADVIDLRMLPGVGEKMAQRIIEHREKNGPFRSLDELRQVRGIGPAILERIRPHLRIGSYTEEAPPPPPRVVRGAAPERTAAEPPAKGKKKPPAEKIDLNRATPEQLKALPGIGPTLAGRIVEARRNRPFRSVDELRKIKGIGAKTLTRLRPHVTVGGDEP